MAGPSGPAVGAKAAGPPARGRASAGPAGARTRTLLRCGRLLAEPLRPRRYSSSRGDAIDSDCHCSRPNDNLQEPGRAAQNYSRMLPVTSGSGGAGGGGADTVIATRSGIRYHLSPEISGKVWESPRNFWKFPEISRISKNIRKAPNRVVFFPSFFAISFFLFRR